MPPSRSEPTFSWVQCLEVGCAGWNTGYEEGGYAVKPAHGGRDGARNVRGKRARMRGPG
jgi:hypothetical protein